MTDFGNTSFAIKGVVPSVFLHRCIKEFPSIGFGYSPFGKNNIINIANTDQEELERINRETTGGEMLKLTYLPAGTKVKIKLRTEDGKRLMDLVKTGEHLKQIIRFDEDEIAKKSFTFYELSVDDEIIVQKSGLE